MNVTRRTLVVFTIRLSDPKQGVPKATSSRSCGRSERGDEWLLYGPFPLFGTFIARPYPKFHDGALEHIITT